MDTLTLSDSFGLLPTPAERLFGSSNISACDVELAGFGEAA